MRFISRRVDVLRASRPRRVAAVLASSAVLAAAAVPALGAPDGSGAIAEFRVAQECPQVANPAVERGWTAYRANQMDAARREFDAALRQCPRHPGARTGLGYVQLRGGQLAEARASFEAVTAGRPDDVDALVGIGIAAWRQGDQRASRTAFTRVRRIDPTNQEARDYLARLGDEPVASQQRPPPVLPDTMVYPARTHGDRFEIRTARGWEPFYIKGVNLGAATPGHHPSEFPDSATYARWLGQMAAMGANTVRVYTIHPPHFYGALAAYNRANAAAPLWIIHGVWAELPEDDDFAGAQWEGEFFAEMRRVVDLLHGRLTLPLRPGRAGGQYTTDVSRWVLAWIIGREWEPYSVGNFNDKRPGQTGFSGRYLTLRGGTPMDAWLAKACEHIVDYEARTYRAMRPVAYTNWPTLDPLKHPTEATVDEEVAIRTRLGERVGEKPLAFDDDRIDLDAALVKTTAAYPAGYFASFHAYPYYPDFMVLDPGYNRASSSEGRSNYFGYLRELKAHHRGMAVVISEYGVPASFGSAHLQPQGWHHGGLTEREMADANARLTREIAEAGMAGGAVFAWIDEWFKKNWLVIAFEIPQERTRLWLNRLDAEQHYGMLAEYPGEAVPGATLAQRLESWRRVRPLYQSPEGTVRAAWDEAYLWVQVETADGRVPDDLFLGFDVIRPEAGDFRWPGRLGQRLPVGLEFVLHAKRGEARLLADPASNPFVVDRVEQIPGQPVAPPRFERALPGFFSGRYQRRFNRPFTTRPNEDGVYDSLRVVTNRRRFGRDGIEYPAMGYDRGILRQGDLPDGQWQMLERGVFETRIPWMLLNFTDPSERRVLQDRAGAPEGSDFGTETVSGVRIVAAMRQGERFTQWPASNRAADVALFTWPTWEMPRSREVVRPTYNSMREVFRTMNPPVLRGGR